MPSYFKVQHEEASNAEPAWVDLPDNIVEWLHVLRNSGDMEAFADFVWIIRASRWTVGQIGRALAGPTPSSLWENQGTAPEGGPAWVPRPRQVHRGDVDYPPMLRRAKNRTYPEIPPEDIPDLQAAYARAMDLHGSEPGRYWSLRHNDNFRARDELAAAAEKYMGLGIPLTDVCEASGASYKQLRAWIIWRRGITVEF